MTRNQDRNLRKAHVRLIEAELRNYPATTRELKEIEEEIASPRRSFDEIKSTDPSDPTPTKAIRMISSTGLNDLRRRVSAIEHLLRIVEADPTRHELIRLTYWSGTHTVPGICQQLHISERTYHRWKRQMLGVVAERLGWAI
jgi:RinA family phage transcriptional activator